VLTSTFGYGGTLSSSTAGVLQLTITASCEGEDCATLAEFAGFTFPCETLAEFDISFAG
jgi:hypothetical protein